MFWSGIAGWDSLARGVVLLPLMLAGSWVGAKLFQPENERLYRNVALVILFAAGAFGLLRDWIMG